MLEPLRQRVRSLLSTARNVTLATDGPAGLQASVVRCAAEGLRLYLLVPRTSDHLVNLGVCSTAVVSADTWQARGEARLLPSSEAAESVRRLIPAERERAHWTELVEFVPRRVQVGGRGGWGYDETIDLV